MTRMALSDAATEKRRQDRAAAIRDFLARFAPGPHDDLLGQMMVTLCRLAADGTGRGDLKLMNSAIQEMRYSFKVFAQFKGVPKVSIFGSARTPEGHPEYQAARKFAEEISRRGWMVITGAGPGIMQAGHIGAARESSIGVAIRLPFEQETNAVITGDPKLISFKYFFTRKLMFVKEASALALFPGGFGTMDEAYEVLTLVQTGKTAPIPIVLCDAPGGGYWPKWRSYVETELLGRGMIDAADLHLFRVTDSVEAAVEEILGFYRRYHSSRYVDDRFVIRLRDPLDPRTVAVLSERFSDILTQGQIEQVPGPLEGEAGQCPEMPRLVFHYDRRSAGRLRLLIDAVNQVG